MNANKLRIWVFLAGVFLIGSSLVDLRNLSHFDRYYTVLEYMPRNAIIIRYWISVAVRVSILICGVGIIFCKDIFRKAIIVLSALTVVTGYWKHPFSCFKYIFKKMEAAGGLSPELAKSSDRMAWILVGYNWAIDLLTALFLIYLLTRPSVKKLFNAP